MKAKMSFKLWNC